MSAMLSIIIATDGQEQPAVATLTALVPGAAAGLIREVLLVDQAASATIARVADVAGCSYLASEGSRAQALAVGAAQARSPWLMFIRAGAVLDASWIDETAQFVQTVTSSGQARAGIFRYARSPYTQPKWRDQIGILMRLAGWPSADQGLLIARDHFERLGGYSTQARSPEARLLRRLGRSSRMLLRSRIMVV